MKKRGKFLHYEVCGYNSCTKYDEKPWDYDFPNCKEGYKPSSTIGMDLCVRGHNLWEHAHRWVYEVIEIIVLTSETVAELPTTDRDRTTIGVGESVKISADEHVTWKISPGLVSISDETTQAITITAQDQVGSVTVTAKNKHDEKSITFTIIAPEDVKYFERQVKHRQGNVSLVVLANMHLLPNNVNFDKIFISELEQEAIGSGYWQNATGFKHCGKEVGELCGWSYSYHNGEYNLLLRDINGVTTIADDKIGIEESDTGCSLGNGTLTVDIPIQWKLGGSEPKTFTTKTQTIEMTLIGTSTITTVTH